MRRSVDQEEAKVIWGLDKWYEKTAYVFGIISIVVYILAFTIGFIVGLVEEANTSSTIDTNYSQSQEDKWQKQ